MKKKYQGKQNLEELENFAKTHSAKEIRRVYGNNGLCLVYRFRFQHPYEYMTSEKKNMLILEELKNGACISDLMRKYQTTRQRIEKLI